MSGSAVDVVSLSLISHTNAGKTTLARTLLRRDVGEVMDQAHVTERSERYVMLEVPGEGDAPGGRIVLWDTPGFGDSARLLRELEGREDPIAWMAAQHWDPLHERALWSSQRAVQNVAEHADVVLYLVNASEEPGMAGYVEPEMRILGWIGRPVVVLLNQTGEPGDAEARRRAEERWRWHLASHAAVHDVISLDAFTRCWVQEGLLLLRLEALVPARHAHLMRDLLARWRGDGERALGEATALLARLLLGAARDREPVGESWVGPVARRRAAAALAHRLAASTRATTDALIALHGLEGESAAWARGELADVSVPGERPDPARAGVLGGIVGGALGGLAADLASAGLSLGGGAIAGAILGGLGLGGLAWAYDQLGGERELSVVWSDALLTRLTEDALLRYLGVAHFGRGSGRFRERVEPALWRPLVRRVVAEEERGLGRLWRRARGGAADVAPPLPDAPDPGADEELARLSALLDSLARRCLIELYPGVERFLGAGGRGDAGAREG